MTFLMNDTPSQFLFCRIEQYSSHRFRQAMRIYLAEFPRDSRLSIARIRTLLKEGNYQLYCCGEEWAGAGFCSYLDLSLTSVRSSGLHRRRAEVER